MANEEPEQATSYLYYEKNSPCFLWTLVLAPCLMPVVWKYSVALTDTELSFGYSSGCMNVSFDRSSILEAEEINNINGFCDWGGYGIRKQLPSFDTGYIARNGPAVRIRVKRANGSETNYTFSCHDPEELVRLLTNY